MNCKQGDLAIIVESAAGNAGKIVRCLALSQERAMVGPRGIEGGPVWIIDQSLVSCGGDRHPYILDAQLRPIRDGEQPDEMLRIVGKPEVETA